MDYISKYFFFSKPSYVPTYVLLITLLDVAINAALMTTRNRKCNNINKIWKTRIFILQNQLIAATIKEINFFFVSVKNIFLDGRDTFASGLLIYNHCKSYIFYGRKLNYIRIMCINYKSALYSIETLNKIHCKIVCTSPSSSRILH